jgi:hypothetical protein
MEYFGTITKQQENDPTSSNFWQNLLCNLNITKFVILACGNVDHGMDGPMIFNTWKI